jgi:hypothetical protein
VVATVVGALVATGTTAGTTAAVVELAEGVVPPLPLPPQAAAKAASATTKTDKTIRMTATFASP